MTIHHLKTLTPFFERVRDGSKPFEVRKNDRDFQVGDTLVLQCWSPMGGYTGHELFRRVTYILAGGTFGVAEGHCVMGLELMEGEDDPGLDGTDAAHPAWWRGERYGSKHAARALQEIAIEGRSHGGRFGGDELEVAAQAILALREPPGPGLSFDRMRRANVERERILMKTRTQLDGWTLLEYAGAAAGEMGELANLCKKIRRGDDVSMGDVANELADVTTYLDLLAAKAGIDLGDAVARKFNEISRRWRVNVWLHERPQRPIEPEETA